MFALPGIDSPLPNGESGASALLVRGFRCVLRVRQLDPVTAYYNVRQLAPLVGRAMLEFRNLACAAPLHGDTELLRALSRYRGGPDLRRITRPQLDAQGADVEAIALRRALIAAYAPTLLTIARRRLALELGCDPDDEPLDAASYVAWFAASMGSQLGRWQGLRFLHDYHKAGVSRSTGLLTLVEQNVTLLAEFPDLDTAIFVDDDEDAESLQLGSRDRAVLRDGFDDFHAREVEAARAVVLTLCHVALDGDRRRSAWASALYGESYARERSSCAEDSRPARPWTA